MKHLKRFNESKDTDIEKLCDDYLAYLKDAGFILNFESIEKYYQWSNCIGISKDKSGFYWEDVKYDLLPFVEAVMKIYNVRSIKIYTPNKHDRVTQHTYIYSSHKDYSNKIEDFLNEKEIPIDKLLIAIEIIFTSYS